MRVALQLSRGDGEVKLGAEGDITEGHAAAPKATKTISITFYSALYQTYVLPHIKAYKFITQNIDFRCLERFFTNPTVNMGVCVCERIVLTSLVLRISDEVPSFLIGCMFIRVSIGTIAHPSPLFLSLIQARV